MAANLVVREKNIGENDMEYIVYLWPMRMGGYQLDGYTIEADSEEEAIDKVVAHLIDNNYHAYYYEVDEIDENEADEMGLMYVDATMEGADRAVYIDASNLRVLTLAKEIAKKRKDLKSMRIYGERLPDEVIDELIEEHIHELNILTKDFIETLYYYDYMDSL